ncbi:MAG: hypothetical protein ABIQ53_00760, partial [Terracoccus sp.]
MTAQTEQRDSPNPAVGTSAASTPLADGVTLTSSASVTGPTQGPSTTRRGKGPEPRRVTMGRPRHLG